MRLARNGMLLLLFFGAQCQWVSDYNFRGDFLTSAPGYHWNYDPEKRIEVGTTTEADLQQYYPGGPRQRLSFRPAVEHKLKGRKFAVDLILVYGTGRRVVTIPADGSFVVSDMVESLNLTVFLHKGTVQEYTINHIIREPREEDYRPGKYDTTFIAGGRELSPGIEALIRRYICQRGVEFARQNNGEYLLNSEWGREAGCPQIKAQH